MEPKQDITRSESQVSPNEVSAVHSRDVHAVHASPTHAPALTESSALENILPRRGSGFVFTSHSCQRHDAGLL